MAVLLGLPDRNSRTDAGCGCPNRIGRAFYADDILRYELLEEAGWLVIRVIAADLSTHRPQLINRSDHNSRIKA